jgi:hypothetical protein
MEIFGSPYGNLVSFMDILYEYSVVIWYTFLVLVHILYRKKIWQPCLAEHAEVSLGKYLVADL